MERRGRKKLKRQLVLPARRGEILGKRKKGRMIILGAKRPRKSIARRFSSATASSLSSVRRGREAASARIGGWFSNPSFWFRGRVVAWLKTRLNEPSPTHLRTRGGSTWEWTRPPSDRAGTMINGALFTPSRHVRPNWTSTAWKLYPHKVSTSYHPSTTSGTRSKKSWRENVAASLPLLIYSLDIISGPNDTNGFP